MFKTPVFALLLLALLSPATTQTDPFPKRPQKPQRPRNTRKRTGRDFLVLNGTWKFLADPTKQGEQRGWDTSAPAEAKETQVPALLSDSGTGENKTGEKVVWLWREFEISPKWKDQTVRLQFEGVAENARVWLNGKMTGAHRGGGIPFTFDVTKLLHAPGEKNTLALRVEGNPEKGMGLWQGVLLLSHDEAYLDECFPQTNLSGNLNAAITLINTSMNTGDATLEARVVAAKEPKRDLKRTLQNLHVVPDRNITTLLTSLNRKSLKLWSPAQPFLYRLQLAFRQDEDVLDTLDTPFGFREFGWQNGAVTLNGETITFRALAPDTKKPVVIATTEDTEHGRELLRRMKQQGVNLVHLEAPPAMLLRLADEEGLLVIVSARPGQSLAVASEELRSLILRDRAHPCVLGWRLPNDAPDVLARLRPLDPTRFFLLGTHLYPPNQNAPVTTPLPAGLQP